MLVGVVGDEWLYRDIVTHVVYLDQLKAVSLSVYSYRLLGASLNTLISIHDKENCESSS